MPIRQHIGLEQGAKVERVSIHNTIYSQASAISSPCEPFDIHKQCNILSGGLIANKKALYPLRAEPITIRQFRSVWAPERIATNECLNLLFLHVPNKLDNMDLIGL